jgi:hypothetical protein
MVKAINFKNWCTENISPQAWARIVLKSLPALRGEGLELNALDNPDSGMVLSDGAMAILSQTLEELYQMKIENEVLT